VRPSSQGLNAQANVTRISIPVGRDFSLVKMKRGIYLDLLDFIENYPATTEVMLFEFHNLSICCARTKLLWNSLVYLCIRIFLNSSKANRFFRVHNPPQQP
jgi:hypothetical protein